MLEFQIQFLIGNYAGYNINSTDANSTVAIGDGALRYLTDGQYNTAIGQGALNANKRNDFNTAVGYRALTAMSASLEQLH